MALPAEARPRYPRSMSEASPTTELVTYESHETVAVLRMDDGKANALGPDMIAALLSALDRAESEGKAVVIAGREGRFCAGFDLKVMGSGPKAAMDLVRAGAELFMRIYLHPRPVVIACTGHAMAGGAVMLLCADERLGAEGPFKLGLNEVQIGMPVPALVMDLAEARLERRAFIPSVQFARVHDPAAAVAAGFLDRVVEAKELEGAALETAALLAKLPARAFASTKRRQRGALVERMRSGLEDDLAQVTADLT